jgi:anti-sigma B factor antagonist
VSTNGPSIQREKALARPRIEIRDEEVDARTHVLELEGDLDAHNAPAFKQRLEDVVAAGKIDLVVDMGKLSFIDSIGLMVLVNGLKSLRSYDGSLALVSTAPRLLRPFEITGVAAMFDFFGTREEALAHLSRARD